MLKASLVVAVTVNSLVFLAYLAYLGCSRSCRPRWRILSFALMVGGFLMGYPKFRIRMMNPEELSSDDLVQHLVFSIGDVISHVGLIMFVYWDIATEAIRFIYALEPAKRKLGMRRARLCGSICMLGQVIFLVPFWSLVYVLEGESRLYLTASFYLVQCFTFFGIMPALIFFQLAHALQKLWRRFPADVPQHVLLRMRFTQLGLGFLLTMGVSDAVFSLLTVFVPLVRAVGGFLYSPLVLISLSLFLLLMQLVEFYLARKSLSSSRQDEAFEPSELLCAARLGSQRQQGFRHVPVWHRGVKGTVAEGFDVIWHTQKGRPDPKTAELTMELLKPLTLAGRLSMWEALNVGSSSTVRLQEYLGKPTVMVSHCWSSSYLQLLEILGRYDENTNRKNFFFLDIFSMNQHDFADLGDHGNGVKQQDVYETMLKALTHSIQVPSSVLLAMTPHEQPKLLTRAWCLYEIYIAWTLNAEVSCGFIPEAEQAVKRSLLTDDALIDQMLNSVDAEKSEATVAADHAMIMSMIRKRGVEKFNSFVKEKLAASLRVVALTPILSDGHRPGLQASLSFRSSLIRQDRAFPSESSETFSI